MLLTLNHILLYQEESELLDNRMCVAGTKLCTTLDKQRNFLSFPYSLRGTYGLVASLLYWGANGINRTQPFSTASTGRSLPSDHFLPALCSLYQPGQNCRAVAETV